jgi:2-keto-4-pentenoate hydratase/2-oxohepta-3-ene-1,7-dioic acid hydratase in catechol pathway
MRLYAYRDRYDCERWGVLVDNALLTGRQLERIGGLPDLWTHLDLGFTIRHGDRWHGRARRAADRSLRRGAKPKSPDRRTPVAAIPDPGKIVCIGLNYRDHALEGGRDAPDRPLLFAKFANAVIADGEPIVRPPGCHALDLEAELGVVIGRSASHVSSRDAMRHVAGYVVVNDVSARDFQGSKPALREGERGDGQWLRAKGSDTFFPIGPVFVTADEFDGPPDLPIRSWRIPGSGPDAGTPVLMQESRTGNLLFDIPTLVEHVSAYIALEPGDIISTGTPAGVGVFRDPPVFLEPGDRVRVEIEGIGRVENPVVDWSPSPTDPAPSRR